MHGTAEGDGVSEISDFGMRNSERGLSNCVIGMWVFGEFLGKGVKQNGDENNNHFVGDLCY